MVHQLLCSEALISLQSHSEEKLKVLRGLWSSFMQSVSWLPLWSYFLSTLSSFVLLQSHWLPHCSLNTLGINLPQDLCICSSFLLDSLSLDMYEARALTSFRSSLKCTSQGGFFWSPNLKLQSLPFTSYILSVLYFLSGYHFLTCYMLYFPVLLWFVPLVRMWAPRG